jgi:hypothetical protein
MNRHSQPDQSEFYSVSETAQYLRHVKDLSMKWHVIQIC